MKYFSLVLAFVSCLSSMAGTDEPIHLSKIQFEGRVSIQETQLLTELRLIVGNSYSQKQIDDAVAHLGSLPYLIEAKSEWLGEGTEKTLLVKIVENKSFILDASYQRSESNHYGSGDSNRIALNYHYYLGKNGVLSVGTVNDVEWSYENNLALSYKNAKLFNTNFQLEVGVDWQEYEDLDEFANSIGSSYTFSSTLSYLLGLNQKLGIQYSKTEFEMADANGILNTDQNSDSQGLFWLYNTQEDLSMPLRGLKLNANWQTGENRYHSEFVDPPELVFLSRSDVEATSFDASYVKPLKQRLSLFGGVNYSKYESKQTLTTDTTSTRGRSQSETKSLALGIRQKLQSFEWLPANSELKWELFGSFDKYDLDLSEYSQDYSYGDKYYSATAKLRYRCPWGSANLSVSYLGD